MFLFHRKKLRFKNFMTFYREIFRAENVIDRITPCQILNSFVSSFLQASTNYIPIKSNKSITSKNFMAGFSNKEILTFMTAVKSMDT